MVKRFLSNPQSPEASLFSFSLFGDDIFITMYLHCDLGRGIDINVKHVLLYSVDLVRKKKEGGRRLYTHSHT